MLQLVREYLDEAGVVLGLRGQVGEARLAGQERRLRGARAALDLNPAAAPSVAGISTRVQSPSGPDPSAALGMSSTRLYTSLSAK